MTGREIEAVAKAIHEHLSVRDVMQYLDNAEDCRGLATAAINALDNLRGWQPIETAPKDEYRKAATHDRN